MGVNNVLIYTGYVESSSWSALAFHHYSKDGAPNATELLRHLAKCVLAGFKSDSEEYNERTHFGCCKPYSKDKTNIFCPKCGNRLIIPEIDQEMLSEFIVDIRTGHTDSIPYELWEILDNNGWHQWGGPHLKMTSFENVVVVTERGEEILAGLALDPDYEIDERYLYLPEGIDLK